MKMTTVTQSPVRKHGTTPKYGAIYRAVEQLAEGLSLKVTCDTPQEAIAAQAAVRAYYIRNKLPYVVQLHIRELSFYVTRKEPEHE